VYIAQAKLDPIFFTFRLPSEPEPLFKLRVPVRDRYQCGLCSPYTSFLSHSTVAMSFSSVSIPVKYYSINFNAFWHCFMELWSWFDPLGLSLIAQQRRSYEQ